MKTSRRFFLQGLSGFSLALPTLNLYSGEIEKDKNNYVFLQIPNGVIMRSWLPKKKGIIDKLPSSLKSLENYKDKLRIISGLKLDTANPNGDGGGDHVRASASFLTGVQALKDVNDYKCGVSVDQFLANRIGKATYLPSLELSSQESRLSGDCDSGYNCIYRYSISWKGPRLPLIPETNPKLVFNRLFSVHKKGEKTKNEILIRNKQRSK